MHGISYHYCREAVASGVCRIAKEDTLTNLSDLFTKALSKARREELLDRFMYEKMKRCQEWVFTGMVSLSMMEGEKGCLHICSQIDHQFED